MGHSPLEEVDTASVAPDGIPRPLHREVPEELLDHRTVPACVHPTGNDARHKLAFFEVDQTLHKDLSETTARLDKIQVDAVVSNGCCRSWEGAPEGVAVSTSEAQVPSFLQKQPWLGRALLDTP